MAEQRPKTTESESSPAAPSRALAEPEPVPEVPKDVGEEKSVIPVPSSDYKPDESKALVLLRLWLLFWSISTGYCRESNPGEQVVARKPAFRI